MKNVPPLTLRWFSDGWMLIYQYHRDWVLVWEGLTFSCSAVWRPSASHPHPRENLPYTSRDASKFLAKWSLFFEERRKGIPHQGDTITPFTVAWLWNFTGDGRNGRHSILVPPSSVRVRERARDAVVAGEREGKMSWVWRRSDSVFYRLGCRLQIKSLKWTIFMTNMMFAIPEGVDNDFTRSHFL